MAIPRPQLLKYTSGVKGSILVKKGETIYFVSVFYITSHSITDNRDILIVLKL